MRYFCENCKNEVFESSNFCGYCGVSLMNLVQDQKISGGLFKKVDLLSQNDGFLDVSVKVWADQIEKELDNHCINKSI